MAIIKRFVSALARLLSVACAGTQFNWQDTEKIKNGMSKSAVIAILGKPYTHTQSGNSATLIWIYTTVLGDAKTASYRFEDDRVVSKIIVGK